MTANGVTPEASRLSAH